MKSTAGRSELVLYKSKDGSIKMDVQLERETLWLSLNQLAELFDRDKSVVSRHLRNIYKEGELSKRATVAKNATVQNEAGREVLRNIEYYNLDAIISVGYRVNSKRGTEFRIWATNVLKQHIVQGYTVNEGSTPATKRYRPWKIAWHCAFPNKQKASLNSILPIL